MPFSPHYAALMSLRFGMRCWICNLADFAMHLIQLALSASINAVRRLLSITKKHEEIPNWKTWHIFRKYVWLSIKRHEKISLKFILHTINLETQSNWCWTHYVSLGLIASQWCASKLMNIALHNYKTLHIKSPFGRAGKWGFCILYRFYTDFIELKVWIKPNTRLDRAEGKVKWWKRIRSYSILIDINTRNDHITSSNML